MGAIPKFNFVPEKQLLRNGTSDSQYRVTIYSKPAKGKDDKIVYNTNLIFTKFIVDVYDLKNKFIRFYGDRENKTLGWSVLEKAEGITELEGVKQFNLNSADICTFGISKLLKAINVEIKDNRRDIPVLLYKSNLQSHPIYYIKF